MYQAVGLGWPSIRSQKAGSRRGIRCDPVAGMCSLANGAFDPVGASTVQRSLASGGLALVAPTIMGWIAVSASSLWLVC